MSSTGLSYTNSQISSVARNIFPFNNADDDILTIEPAIHELLSYTDFNEKNDNNNIINNDNDNQNNQNNQNNDSFQSRYQKNNLRDHENYNFQNQNDTQDPWGTKRAQLGDELKNIVFMEHKKYMILARVSTYGNVSNLHFYFDFIIRIYFFLYP